MQIEFLGAARTVTGSCYIIKDDDFTIMVDCGMFQGKRDLKERNSLHRIYSPKKIDALLLTHAHIDHSGLIPKLVKEGFYGNIYATNATTDLCSVMLPDSAHIQEMDAKWVNKKNKKLGRDLVEPQYTVKDSEKSLENFVPVNYGEMVQIHPRIKVRFRDAGHILGSSIIEMWVDEKGKQTKIVFSGDLGPKNQAIIKDPEIIEEADFLLIESTYGNRLHKSKEDTYKEFFDILKNAHFSNGNIIIPAFAIERTQEIIYTLSKVFNDGKIPRIPVYIDSPLAISATEIFRKNDQCFDDATRKILMSGNSPLDFENLFFSRTAKESKALNELKKGAIIISASGMCTAGRIKYHLQNNIYKPETSVIFVGYQAAGTLGRRIVDGAQQVKVYGEDVAVKAKIYTLGGFSAHADKNGLLEWISHIKNPNLKVFIVHGEEASALEFAESVREKFGYFTHVPRWKEVFDLETMNSEIAPHEDHLIYDKMDSISKDIDSLIMSVETLGEKFRVANDEKKIFNAKLLRDDIKDIKEFVAMVLDEM